MLTDKDKRLSKNKMYTKHNHNAVSSVDGAFINLTNENINISPTQKVHAHG